MPIYTIENTETGETLQVEGDNAPTPEEAQEIFENQYNPTAEVFGKIGQGLTFGFGDEIASAIQSALGSGDYDTLQRRKKRQREAFERNQPTTALLSELGGGLLTGGLGAGKVLASQAFRNAPRAARIAGISGLGAAEGGLYGAGTAEEGQRLQGAADSAATGAVFAPLASGAANVGGRIFGTLANRLSQVLQSSPQTDSLKVIRKMAEDAGLNPDAVADEYKKLGPQGTLADTSDVLRSTLRSTMNRPGNVKERASDFVEARNKDQRERLLQNLRASTDAPDLPFRDVEKNIVRKRFEESSPFYDEALQQGIEITPTLRPLLNNPNIFTAANNFLKDEGLPPLKKPTAKELEQNPRMTAFDNLTPQRRYELLKETKEYLDDKINKTFLAGEKNRSRRFKNQKNVLLGEMISQNPAYARANEIYADESSLKNALDLGKKSFDTKYTFGELQDIVKDMTQGEREMFQLGLIERVSKITNESVAKDKSKIFRERGDYRDKLALALGDRADDFIDSLDVEEAFQRTRMAATGNSSTLEQKKFDDALSEAVDQGIIKDAADLNPGTIISSVINILTPRDASPETVNLIGETLIKRGLTRQQVINILKGTPVRRALGDDYDELVGPYLRGAAISATTPTAESL